MPSLKRYRKTKIIATLGPASSTREIIGNLFKSGVDVFRLNFSHGTHEDHRKRISIIREIEKERNRPIGVFADMQGPKLRLGTFKNGEISIKKGMRIILDSNPEPGDERRVYLPHPEILEALQEGSDILLDDGNVHLRVIKKGSDFIETEVIAGKKLMNRKGVNLPNVILKVSSLTDKDRIDLEAAIDMGADWIALSFVQRPEDVEEARALIGIRAKIIVKIEKPSALESLDEIIDISDAVMVARGDLGVEIPAESVPSVQKRIVRVCRKAGKPVIIATQMLESMTSSPRPTRAEASDVATAIYDGTDAVMLSAETAAGEYPIEAVEIMDKIAADVEKDHIYRKIMDAEHPDPGETSPEAITSAAYWVAMTLSAAAIVNYTTSGSTTLRTARERPSVPILCLTENMIVARRLQLSYGVHSVHTKDVESFSDMVKKACRISLEHNIAQKGQRLVITAGVPFGTPGSTNILRVAWVE
ncbi:MAG: pyruvate kinase [Alphaproteobacteria bacterium]|nr:pyruvate kinase [Alphaproteobacteria bacterium]MCK5518069.1 pyruvate kinase [Alphaproteobacteria bacterium]MCK5658561.1 pyruvate kinase [Alphaproteobacteria bacterium]